MSTTLDVRHLLVFNLISGSPVSRFARKIVQRRFAMIDPICRTQKMAAVNLSFSFRTPSIIRVKNRRKSSDSSGMREGKVLRVLRIDGSVASPTSFSFHSLYNPRCRNRKRKKNYNSKREDLEEEDQGEDERNVIL